MKIALLGYGKMGKIIESIALERGHEVTLIIDIDNKADMTPVNLNKADVAIDFSMPVSVYDNILKCFEANIPIVCGTTGWLEKYDEIVEKCKKENKAFFYASNYSIGVNIFFSLNRYLSKIMNSYSDYKVDIEEIHHTQKLDAPSGTAISLAQDIIENHSGNSRWELISEPKNDDPIIDKKILDDTIPVKALREPDVPGIHKIRYENDIDYIEIKHSAKSRRGFALGAVLAAEFINGKTGIFSMKDLMKLA